MEVWLKKTEWCRNFSRFQADFNDSLIQVRALSSTIDAFEMEAFKQRKTQNEFLKNAPQKDKLSPDFMLFLQDQINYHYWHQLLAYSILNANKDQKILTVSPLPAVMLEGLEKVNVSNEKLWSVMHTVSS